jgi:exopolysaccharide biosynthesis protein
VDVKRCDISASSPMGRHLAVPKGGVCIDANYFWQGKPIGVLLDHGRRASSLPLIQPRAVLVIKDKHAFVLVLTPKEAQDKLNSGIWKGATVIQAGPRIITHGKIVPPSALKQERFRASVYRRTQHTAIGITKEGKLLLAFIRGRTVAEVAAIMQHAGAVECLNLDGGSSASLTYNGRRYGATPRTALIVRPLR